MLLGTGNTKIRHVPVFKMLPRSRGKIDKGRNHGNVIEAIKEILVKKKSHASEMIDYLRESRTCGALS